MKGSNMYYLNEYKLDIARLTWNSVHQKQLGKSQDVGKEVTYECPYLQKMCRQIGETFYKSLKVL